MSAPCLASIPPHRPFLDTLARAWIDRHSSDPSRGLILLPTRRAARALAEAFLHVSGGAPMLLPRITAIGAIDEAPLALAGGLALPPAVAPMRRLACLARLVLALPEAEGGVRAADRAMALARELAGLMDEAEGCEIPLERALASAADGAYARHWDVTLRFLGIVTRAWPDWLAAEGLMNPTARQVAVLDAQAREWAARPPSGPVWAAGLTGATPAVTRLLRVVAGLPGGCVVLPWLDRSLAGEALADTHPQAALHALLAGLGATVGDVAVWEGGGSAVPVGREHLLADALLPASLLHRWRDVPAGDTTGLSRLAADDQQEEALAVALVLRQALETPGQRCALVTPDRDLAGRVCAELRRWGVVADDSAGEKLADTPPAVFLRLLARLWVENFAPVPLLSVLKHPFAASGLPPASCRRAARALERAALRSPRPPPGFTGLRRALGDAPEPSALDLIERSRACMEPLLRLVPPHAYPPASMLRALIEAAEAMAGTDAAPGEKALWAGEEGSALADLLVEALQAFENLPDQAGAVLPGLLDAVLEGAVVRSRRALRASDADAEHPRVFIWGLLEARLQAVDVVVLGGLCEATWPPATDPGPWMSRPMRARAGLPSVDARIGQAGHDFVMAACMAPLAVLSAPSRRDGAPAVPSRWLARLDARLGGRGLPTHSAVGWSRLLDQPERGRAVAADPPLPCPPVALRPRTLSASEIETLIADPYAIYAKRVLRLRPLDPLEQATDALDYGLVVHRGMELFLRRHRDDWPAVPAPALKTAMVAALSEQAVRPSVAAWWLPRLERIADWVAAEETRRRAVAGPARIEVEHRGEWSMGEFTIVAKADRIEVRADGSVAVLDYKTGQPPKRPELLGGSAPQLPLEAAMVEAGAFPNVAGQVRELTYWQLAGGHVAGCAKTPLKTEQELADLVADTPGHIGRLLRDFDDPSHPYPHCPHPGRATKRTEYAQLARAGERAAARDEE